MGWLVYSEVFKTLMLSPPFPLLFLLEVYGRAVPMASRGAPQSENLLKGESYKREWGRK